MPSYNAIIHIMTVTQMMRNGIDTGKHPAAAAWLLGAVHLAVDLASIGTLYTVARAGLFSAEWVALLILGYDYIAFATQMFIGYALDRLGLATWAAAAGCILTAAGAWLAAPAPVAAVAVVALGNALFHVGGGTVCLRAARGRAIWAGIFVAPGAIGLFLGKQIGGTGMFAPWALAVLLALGALASLTLRGQIRTEHAPLPAVKSFGLVAAALIVTVALRSLVGFSVTYPWASGWQQAVWLTLAVFAGKAMGGALGDWLGWRQVTVAGLLLSAPMLAFGSGIPLLAVAGTLLFNLTMAVTLAGLAWMLPGHEGFAFGLTTTAIVVGMTPSILPAWKPLLSSPWAIAGLILLSAAALWLALGRLEIQRGAIRTTIKQGGLPNAL